MVDIKPLPIRTHLVHGEDVDSYAHRLSENNGTTVEHMEKYMRLFGALPVSKDRSHPALKEAWRAVGNLPSQAFTEPKIVFGNKVVSRRLCQWCSGPGVRASGRRPDIGWVCLKHHRWIGNQGQRNIASFDEALAAERMWRRHLVPRGIVVEGQAVFLARECAIIGTSAKVLEGRKEITDHLHLDLLVYPETVSITKLISSPAFLDVVLDASLPLLQRRSFVEKSVEEILPEVDDAENWRAVARIWNLTMDLHKVVQRDRFKGKVPEDRWNILRYWSGYLPSQHQTSG